jgi:molybdopterin synthase catalytic subunit
MIATSILRAAVTPTPIALAEHEALVAQHAAGAVVGFAGVVRDHDGGRSVVHLEYTAHPSAQSTLAGLLAEIACEAKRVRALAVSHRVGPLVVGEAALVAAVSADHRRAAFETCAVLVEAIKAKLPVWKHQFFADGADEWVGLGVSATSTRKEFPRQERRIETVSDDCRAVLGEN